jgi:hypothetical protein
MQEQGAAAGGTRIVRELAAAIKGSDPQPRHRVDRVEGGIAARVSRFSYTCQ